MKKMLYLTICIIRSVGSIFSSEQPCCQSKSEDIDKNKTEVKFLPNLSYGGLAQFVKSNKAKLSIQDEYRIKAEIQNYQFKKQLDDTGVMLNLGNQGIKHIYPGAFNGCVKVKSLCLFYNKLTRLDPGTFKELINLEKLYLHWNKLTELHSEDFYGLVNLKELFLMGNELTYVDPEMLKQFPKLTFVHLENNKLTTKNIKELQQKLPDVNIDC